MGLPQFPMHGVIPELIIGTILSMAMLKNAACNVLRHIGFRMSSPEINNELSGPSSYAMGKVRNIKFDALQRNGENMDASAALKCSVCLSKLRDTESVSEVRACQHLFHQACLEKWLEIHIHSSCPICRAIV